MPKSIRNLTFSILCFSIFSSKAQSSEDFIHFNLHLWVAKYEVSNAQYQQFINESPKEKANSYKVDSTQWLIKLDRAVTEPMYDKYHRHPAYHNYPVVNISKQAAENYCLWLTEKYQSSQKGDFKKVIFRLPSEKEWMSFSSPLAGHRLPWYGNLPYTADDKGKISEALANIKAVDYRNGDFNYSFDGSVYCSELGSYKANNIGLFDIIGNVAELTSDDKIKGGSWHNTLAESYINLVQNYSSPDPRVGFRVVMEVLEP